MIIIGEKLNSSIPKTLEALKKQDETEIIELIKKQEQKGAEYLDINTAMTEKELDDMIFVIELVKKHSGCGIMIDSTNVETIKSALLHTDNRKVIINSVTASERLDELAEIICEKGAYVVGLPIDKSGILHDSGKITEIAFTLIDKIISLGINKEKILIDVLAQAVSVGDNNAVVCLDTIKAIKARRPDIKTVCGLSNISYGLPKRLGINSAFLSAAIINGLDAAIMDITSEKMQDSLYASLVVAGKDEYCLNYLEYIRSKR